MLGEASSHLNAGPDSSPTNATTAGAKAHAGGTAGLGAEFNRTGTEFLKVDVATGLTFAKAALDSHDPEKKRRNQRSARKAYDTIVRMLKKITPTDADARQLDASLHQLKNELIQLGEIF